MDFDFSQEQYMFQKSVRAFLDEKLNLAKVRAPVERDQIEAQLWQGLSGLGVFSMLVPEEFGGLGLNLVDLALVIEELGRALVPPPVAETIGATDVIHLHATAEQKARFLPEIGEGRMIIVPAFCEAAAGFDPSSISLTAVPTKDGWSVSGSKILVPYAGHSDLMLVALKFDPGGSLGLAAIEPSRPGVSVHAHASVDVLSQYYEVNFDHTPIARADIIGAEPRADSAWRLFDASGMMAALQMTGIAAKILDSSVVYAQQRTQFGSPIGSFQAIKHRCADMAVSIDASRSAAYYAAWALADGSEGAAKAVSMAKSYCGDAARSVCNEGIQIHGGIGFTWELGLHLYLRRTKVLECAFGDAAYHRERVVAATLAQLLGGD
jgi:alkylation response protein AidB-like acyl-CoA dehydrogenase